MEKQTIPGWSVQQAFPIEKYPLKEGEWFAVTEKLNGVRATYHMGKMVSRTGKIFEGLEHIEKVLRKEVGLGYVLDGELTLRNKTGLDDNAAFRKAAGIINSDAEDKTDIVFTVFDIIDLPEFDDGGGTSYRERLRLLGTLHSFVLEPNPYVHILPNLYSGTNQSLIPHLLDMITDAGGEGLIVNRDVPYKRKRHSGILKVKRFYTMDLPIIRVEEGTGKYKGMMGSIVVDFKGNEVGVGTGFTDEQRRYFWEQRETLTGTLAEVKYKEISKNKQTGAESLQFPVFVGLRTDKTEVSYG